MGKIILFVDDEKRWTATYVEELQACGYDVLLETHVDNALQFFEEHRDQIALLILDIMMPPGSSFTQAETQMGMRTGVRFYEKVRQKVPGLYVIILTNVSDEKVKNMFCRENTVLFLKNRKPFPMSWRNKCGLSWER